jgi:hypothetical protein
VTASSLKTVNSVTVKHDVKLHEALKVIVEGIIQRKLKRAL